MIIADTGFWLALANSKDRQHDKAREALELYQEPLITTWPVMTETCHLLLNRLGVMAELAFLKSYERGAFNIFPLQEEHTDRLIRLMTRYADLPMDLADASLVILAEEYGDGRILSTDERDFKTYRWKNRKPFENLMG